MYSCWASIYRFNIIFQRHFDTPFAHCNELVWCHANEDLVDFTSLTFQRETGTAIDLLCMGYRPHLFLYVLDELFFI